MVSGQLLFVDEWKWDYDLNGAFPTIVPIWLRLPQFPIGLWSKKNIVAKAKVAGKPIYLDPAPYWGHEQD